MYSARTLCTSQDHTLQSFKSFRGRAITLNKNKKLLLFLKSLWGHMVILNFLILPPDAPNSVKLYLVHSLQAECAICAICFLKKQAAGYPTSIVNSCINRLPFSAGLSSSIIHNLQTMQRSPKHYLGKSPNSMVVNLEVAWTWSQPKDKACMCAHVKVTQPTGSAINGLYMFFFFFGTNEEKTSLQKGTRRATDGASPGIVHVPKIHFKQCATLKKDD